MNRVSVVVLCFLFCTISPMIAQQSSANLVDNGVTQEGDEFVLFHRLTDNSILTVDVNGNISKNAISAGILTPTWTYETNLSTNSAAIDDGELMLALCHDLGFLSFNLQSISVMYYNNNTDTTDMIDWDPDGDIWLSYGSGQRKAIEYDSNGPTDYQSNTISSGFLSFLILANGDLAFGAMDFKVHIYDQGNNLIRKLSGPNSYISTLYEDDSNNLLVGSGNGKIYHYDSVNWAETTLDLQTNAAVTYIMDYSDSYYVGTSQGEFIEVDKSTLQISHTWQLSGEIVGSYHYFSNQISVLTTQQNYALYYLDIDSDGDGVSDTSDAYPSDSTQFQDSDLDGYGDNPEGINGDAFPYDSTQYSDIDGDGFGDNIDGNNSDAFPNNPTQNSDLDGDGYGDNSTGIDGDKFPIDSTQWSDSDGDGYGDNSSGNNPDGCPLIFGTSTLDRLGCLDSDLDKYSDPDSTWEAEDGADALPFDITQWSDSDLDGYGDNPSPALNPDACPLIPGNSTLMIRTDGSTVQKLGCLDTDGDQYDDDSDYFPTNHLEWYDGDRDGAGANSDFDDTAPEFQTLENYCIKTGNESIPCKNWNDLDYREYLDRDKSEGEADLSYAAWSAQKEAGLLDEDEGLMGVVKDVAIVGGGIFVVATVLIILISFVIKKRKISDLVKRYGVPFEPKEKNIVNQEALEGSAGLSATGGIEADDSWEDEVQEMDFSDKIQEDDEAESNIVSADELYSDESDMSELAGIEVSGVENSHQEATEMLAEEQETTGEKPATIPPIPESGLPEGWTMEQWEWYGHEWLAKIGEN